MVGRNGWTHGWWCLEEDCPAMDDDVDTGKQADKDARAHERQTRHATSTWAQPPLPIAVKR